MKRVYLDCNATTPLHPEALKAMTPFLSGLCANPSSQHQSGRFARAAVEDARISVASSLRCMPEELVFTSGATESNNIAIEGFLKKCHPYATRTTVATSLIEHSSVFAVFKRLERRGFKVVWMRPLPNGVVPPEEAQRAAKEGAVFFSLMFANNETGVIQPVAEISKIAKAAGATVHCDAVQGYGKMALSVDGLGVDFLTLSAHKAYAPKGIGALYIRKGVLLEPLAAGGGHERGVRPGTENVPAIVAFGRMAELIDSSLKSYAAHEQSLREALEDGVLSAVGDCVINGASASRIPNTSSIGFKGVEAPALAAELDRAGVEISTSSACSSGSGPSKVLKEMGVPPAFALGSIRVSNGVFNTLEEAGLAAETIVKCVTKLRKR